MDNKKLHMISQANGDSPQGRPVIDASAIGSSARFKLPYIGTVTNASQALQVAIDYTLNSGANRLGPDKLFPAPDAEFGGIIDSVTIAVIGDWEADADIVAACASFALCIGESENSFVVLSPASAVVVPRSASAATSSSTATAETFGFSGPGGTLAIQFKLPGGGYHIAQFKSAHVQLEYQHHSTMSNLGTLNIVSTLNGAFSPGKSACQIGAPASVGSCGCQPVYPASPPKYGGKLRG